VRIGWRGRILSSFTSLFALQAVENLDGFVRFEGFCRQHTPKLVEVEDEPVLRVGQRVGGGGVVAWTKSKLTVHVPRNRSWPSGMARSTILEV
jgi:hypothetical protein